MSLRHWLRQSLRDAASAATRGNISAVPAPEESQVVLRSTPRGTVEHVAKLPPEVLTTTQNVAYDWDYSVQRAELRTLYEKSKDLTWNARTDLDWSIDVDPDSLL